MQLILSPPQSKREDQLLGTVVQVEEPHSEGDEEDSSETFTSSEGFVVGSRLSAFSR